MHYVIRDINQILIKNRIRFNRMGRVGGFYFVGLR